jgi:hypothetical protein
MTNNWWGTIDTEEIELMIYDAKNDFYLPTAEYAPVATEEIPDAGSNLPYPPIANAGPDQPGDGGLPIEWDTTVTLDGSATYDPDDLIAYSWKQTGGPSVILRDSDQAKTSFVAPSVESGNSVLTFQLTVTDPKGFYDSDEISVTINETAVKVKRDEGGTCFVGTMKELDAGFWMLVSGCWFLVSGCWFLVFGCRMLVSGCCFLFPGYRHQATRIKYQASSIKHQASSIKHLASSIRHQASGILIILLGALFFFSPPAFAGYFSVGAGGGGAAEDFNLSFEAGAAEVELGGRNYIFGAGLPVIPHGYNSDILEGPCDNAECIRGDDEPEGTELGLFGKVGMESLYPKMYLSLLLGFTRGTEVQTVRSLATGWEYEQSSEKKNYMLFGVGASYFTEMFDLDLSFQLDIDNRRGITAGVGLHW